MTSTWVQLDTRLPSNPKFLAVGPRGGWLYVQGLCYAGEHLTDGFIPAAALALFGPDALELSSDLVTIGLWVEVPGGWQIHDYLSHQRSKDYIESRRQSDRERQQRSRATRKRPSPERVSHDVSHNVTSPDSGDMSEPSRVTVTPTVTRESRLQNRTEQNKETTTSTPSYGHDVTPLERATDNLSTPDGVAPKMPRVHLARGAVESISAQLGAGRAAGGNAWNLSELVKAEWDKLHDADEIGACIQLTAWYVAALTERNLEGQEISRIGQLIRRFGRIALEAIDEAVVKDLDDLVSYAYRVAQGMHRERTA